LLIPIAALSATRNRIWTTVWVVVTSALGAVLFLMESSDQLWENYIEAQMQSDGGAIRVTMNAVPSVFFLLFNKRLRFSKEEARLWWWISVFSLACFPLLSYSSTAVDRVALYFIPIQLVVLAHLPSLRGWSLGEFLGQAIPLLYGALVLWVWLTYAVHASLWIPYDIWIPFG
jgi:hypothetical protein